ncbi:MAG: hypothetical protein Q8L72_11450 [Moraxellaceae bacterium]|nr:hypothetical protein [Moraxellaceae bacterium]
MSEGKQVPPLTSAERVTIISVSIRLSIYTAMITAFALSLKAIIIHEGLDAFYEGHWVENLQMLLLALTAVFYAAVANLSAKDHGVLAKVMALLAAFAVIREGDAFWDRVMPAVGWELFGTLIFLGIVYVVVQGRQHFPKQVATFMGMRGMTLAWAGFMVAIPLAQIVAHGPLFQLIMGAEYMNTFKRMIEETLELVGYMMIFFSSVEHFYQTGCWQRVTGQNRSS